MKNKKNLDLIQRDIAATETESVSDYLQGSVYVDIRKDLMRINDVLAVYPGYEPATAEDLLRNIERHSYNKIFKKVMEKFQQKYGYTDENLSEVHDRSFFSLSAFYISSKTKSIVFIDAMFSDFLHAVFVLIFLWDNHLEDSFVAKKCYKYLIANFCVFIKNKAKIDVYLFQEVIKEIKQQSTIFNIAVGCQYFCVYFIFAHEVAHGYIKQKDLRISLKQEEYLADSIAYDVMLDLLLDERETVDILDRELLDYCYYAPMLFCDIMDVHDLFYELIFKHKVSQQEDTHPTLANRKRNLFHVLKKYDLNLDERTKKDASIIFMNFSRLIKEFKRKVREDSSSGALDKFISILGVK